MPEMLSRIIGILLKKVFEYTHCGGGDFWSFKNKHLKGPMTGSGFKILFWVQPEGEAGHLRYVEPFNYLQLKDYIYK